MAIPAKAGIRRLKNVIPGVAEDMAWKQPVDSLHSLE